MVDRLRRLGLLRARIPRRVRRALSLAHPARMAGRMGDGARELLWERRHGIPLIKNVQIQTHSSCNANCVFCPYVESWHAKHRGKMSDDTFDLVLTQLEPFETGINMGKVCPYLMQEPLLDARIFERTEKIYERFPRTLVEISTNALSLNERAIDGLLRVLSGRRHEIWVSHHGIDTESMKYIMDIDFDRATRNLLDLLERSDGRLVVKIRGAGTSRAGHVRLFDRQQYVDHWSSLFEQHDINLENVDIDSFTFHDRAGTIRRTERDAHENNTGFRRRIDRDHPFHCDRVDEWIHIMYDGTIRICCMDYLGEVPLPSVHETTIVEYLRSATYRSLVGRVTGRVRSEDDFICKRCGSPGG